MQATDLVIRPATAIDDEDVAALLDAAFGPGRHARTASLLRRGAEQLAASVVARDAAGHLAGSVQLWRIALVADTVLPLTLLGPVAVAADARAIGLGRRMIAAALARVDAAGLDPVLLIGDASYYGRFGFTAAATGGWSLPGPVERDRLLLRQARAGPLPAIARVVALVDAEVAAYA